MFAIDYLPLKWGYDHSTRHKVYLMRYCTYKYFIMWELLLLCTVLIVLFHGWIAEVVYDVWTLSLKLCVQWKIVRLTVEINKNNKKKRHEHFSFMFKKNFLCQSSIMNFPATKQCSTPRMPILNNLRTT